MQTLRKVILISAGLIAAAGLAGEAAAQNNLSRDSHVMTVRLPDGSLERIRYTGDQAPIVAFERGNSANDDFFAPIFDDFGPNSPFAEMDRVSAAMDRQAAAMLQQVDAMEHMSPNALTETGFGKLPPGTRGYTVISTMSGNQTCTRSARYFTSGDGKPHVETASSGSCGAARSSAQPLHTVAPRPLAVPKGKLIEANYHPARTPDQQNAGPVKVAGLF